MYSSLSHPEDQTLCKVVDRPTIDPLEDNQAFPREKQDQPKPPSRHQEETDHSTRIYHRGRLTGQQGGTLGQGLGRRSPIEDHLRCCRAVETVSLDQRDKIQAGGEVGLDGWNRVKKNEAKKNRDMVLNMLHLNSPDIENKWMGEELECPAEKFGVKFSQSGQWGPMSKGEKGPCSENKIKYEITKTCVENKNRQRKSEKLVKNRRKELIEEKLIEFRKDKCENVVKNNANNEKVIRNENDRKQKAMEMIKNQHNLDKHAKNLGTKLNNEKNERNHTERSNAIENSQNTKNIADQTSNQKIEVTLSRKEREMKNDEIIRKPYAIKSLIEHQNCVHYKNNKQLTANKEPSDKSDLVSFKGSRYKKIVVLRDVIPVSDNNLCFLKARLLTGLEEDGMNSQERIIEDCEEVPSRKEQLNSLVNEKDELYGRVSDDVPDIDHCIAYNLKRINAVAEKNRKNEKSNDTSSGPATANALPDNRVSERPKKKRRRRPRCKNATKSSSSLASTPSQPSGPPKKSGNPKGAAKPGKSGETEDKGTLEVGGSRLVSRPTPRPEKGSWGQGSSHFKSPERNGNRLVRYCADSPQAHACLAVAHLPAAGSREAPHSTDSEGGARGTMAPLPHQDPGHDTVDNRHSSDKGNRRWGSQKRNGRRGRRYSQRGRGRHGFQCRHSSQGTHDGQSGRHWYERSLENNKNGLKDSEGSQTGHDGQKGGQNGQGSTNNSTSNNNQGGQQQQGPKEAHSGQGKHSHGKGFGSQQADEDGQSNQDGHHEHGSQGGSKQGMQESSGEGQGGSGGTGDGGQSDQGRSGQNGMEDRNGMPPGPPAGQRKAGQENGKDEDEVDGDERKDGLGREKEPEGAEGGRDEGELTDTGKDQSGPGNPESRRPELMYNEGGFNGARPKVYNTKKKTSNKQQDPFRRAYKLLQRKARGLEASEDVIKACEELDKCLVRCLRNEKHDKCLACCTLHSQLKHVAMCNLSHWSECDMCRDMATLIKFHLQQCVCGPPSGLRGSAGDGQFCRLNVPLCEKLGVKVRERRNRDPYRALEEVWHTPQVWTRLKSYLSQLLDTRMLVSSQPSSGEFQSMTSIGFASVAICTLNSIQLSHAKVMLSIEESTEEEPVHLSAHAWQQWAQPSDHVQYGDRTDLIIKTAEWQRMKGKHRAPQLNEEEVEQGIIFSYMAEDMRLMYPGGRYKKGEQWETAFMLGRGMSSRCSLAQDSQTFFKFCVKEIPLEKFEPTEVGILTRLRHPSICRCFGALLTGDTVFILLEYVEGCSLQHHISVHRRLTSVTAMVFFKQLLEVLQYLQDQGILHEDIKSENVLLKSGSTQLVLIDFGLARQLTVDYPRVPRDQAPVGSQTQWSPEKAQCIGYSHESDVWAAACLLCEMVSGSPPWIKRFPGAACLTYKIVMASPPVEDIPEDVDSDIRDLITRLWSVEPELRPSASSALEHPAFNLIRQNLGYINTVCENRHILISGAAHPVPAPHLSPTSPEDDSNIPVSPFDQNVNDLPETPRSPGTTVSGDIDIRTLSEKRKQEDNFGASAPRCEASRPSGSSGSITESQAFHMPGLGGIAETQEGYFSGLGGTTESQASNYPGQHGTTGSQEGYFSGHLGTTESQAGNSLGLSATAESQAGYFSGLGGTTESQAGYIPGLSGSIEQLPIGSSEQFLPNLSIFSRESSGSSVDLEKVMKELDFSDLQFHNSSDLPTATSEPIEDVPVPTCESERLPEAGPQGSQTNSAAQQFSARPPLARSSQSRSFSEIEDEYKELQEELLSSAASVEDNDHDSDKEDDHLTAESQPPSMSVPQDIPEESEVGTLVVFLDGESSTELSRLRVISRNKEYVEIVLTTSGQIQPKYQDGYNVHLPGQGLVDLTAHLTENGPRVELEVWPHKEGDDWYVHDRHIIYSDHFTGHFMH